MSPTEEAAAQCEDLVKVYRTASSAVSALRGVTAQFPQARIATAQQPDEALELLQQDVASQWRPIRPSTSAGSAKEAR